MKEKSELLCSKNAHPFYFTVGILSPLSGAHQATVNKLRDGPLEKLWRGRGLFEPQEFFFVIKFLA